MPLERRHPMPAMATPSFVTPSRRAENGVTRSSGIEAMLALDPVGVDTGIFEVDVSEEMRRSIDMDSIEVVANNSKMEQAIKTEKNVAHQLQADVSHANAEGADSKNKASELLESTKVQELLKTTLQNELAGMASSTKPKTATTPPTNDSIRDEQQFTKTPQEEGVTTKSTVLSYQILFEEINGLSKNQALVNQKQKESATEIHKQIVNARKDLEASRSNQSELEQEAITLQKKRFEAEDENAAIHKLISEKQEQLKQNKLSTSQHKEEAEVKMPELECLKKENAVKEKILMERMEHAKMQFEQQEESLARHLAQREGLKEAIESLKQQLAKCEQQYEKTEHIRHEMETAKKANAEALRTEAEAQARLSDATTLLDEATNDLLVLKEEEIELQGEKVVNDRFEADFIALGTNELANIATEKEHFLALVDEVEREISAHRKAVDNALTDIKEKQDITEENLKTVQADIESIRQKRCNFQCEHEKVQCDTASEMEELETCINIMEESNKAKQRHIDNVLTEYRNMVLCNANDALDRESGEVIQLRDTLRNGKTLLKRTVREKQRILSPLK